MSLTAALLIVAQSAAPQVAQSSDIAATSSGRPIAVQVRASARILRPVRIDFARIAATADQSPNAAVNGIQRERDAAGTVWLEFN